MATRVDEPTPRSDRPDGGSEDRLGTIIAIALAAVGVVAALIAWQVGEAGGIAGDATLEALGAARSRSAQSVIGQSRAAQTLEAWLDYERGRRRAEALRNAGLPAEGLREAEIAVAHWFLVRPEYIDPEGSYDPERHRRAFLAEAASEMDLEPEPHLQTARQAEERSGDLLLAGVVVAVTLPVLTVAEIAKGRLRRRAVIGGIGLLAISLVLVGSAWL